MITKPTDWVAAIQAPSREVQAMVIINDINQVDDLKSINIQGDHDLKISLFYLSKGYY